jgi:hypothetical protein
MTLLMTLGYFLSQYTATKKNRSCLFVNLFGGVSKVGEIRTLLKTSLPVAVLRVAKGRIP